MHACPPHPPEALVRSILDGPSRVTSFEWRDEVASTNALLAAAAAEGLPEIAVVGADVQTSGRGRLGRPWHAPTGSSLQVSFLLRPHADMAALTLLPLVAGVALAEVAEAHVEGAHVRLKWPNDLLVDGGKAAGILVERSGDAVVVGIGVNVDWRGVERPEGLEHATSLSEATGRDIDRWKVLAGLVGVLDRRYGDWQERPNGILDAYRSRCATLGARVRIVQVNGSSVVGTAVGIADDGALELEIDGSVVRVRAGEVTHLRPA